MVELKLQSYYEEIKYIDPHGNKKSIFPQQILKINDIENLSDISNNYFLVSSLCELLNKKVKNKQKELDELNSKLTLEYTNSEELRKMNNNKKPTKDVVQSAVLLDNSYKKCKSELIELQSKYNILNNLTKALVQKKDLLQTLNSNARVEKQLSSTGLINTHIKNQFSKSID